MTISDVLLNFGPDVGPLVLVVASPVLLTLAQFLTPFHPWSLAYAHPLLALGVVAVTAVLLRLYSNSASLPANYSPNLKGKNAIVTGGNIGIGFRVAATLAKWGANVTIACRKPDAGREAVTRILQEIGSTNPDQVTFQQLDLSSQDSVRAFAAEWKKDKRHGGKLDYLVNNAGIMMTPFGTTKEGIEIQFGTNHIGHFLLTRLLLDEVRAAKGRVVNVSSNGHYLGGESLPLQSLASPKPEGYDPSVAYGYSKAANIMFSRTLNKRLEGTGATATSVHPGFVNSNLMNSSAGQTMTNIIGATLNTVVAKTTQNGADAVLFATVHEGSKPGAYHKDCHPARVFTKMVYDDTKCEELWAASEQMTLLK